jgi:hypothetical protein
MAAPLSFRMVKIGGFASPDFSGFAPCLWNARYRARKITPRLLVGWATDGINGVQGQTTGNNVGVSGNISEC